MRTHRPEGVSRRILEMLAGAEAEGLFGAAVELACRGWCEHYDGKGGEGECAGFEAVLRRLAAGRLDARVLAPLLDVGPPPPERSEILDRRLCRGCGYRAGDCDFTSPNPPGDAVPCGGYRLLSLLLHRGLITLNPRERP